MIRGLGKDVEESDHNYFWFEVLRYNLELAMEEQTKVQDASVSLQAKFWT